MDNYMPKFRWIKRPFSIYNNSELITINDQGEPEYLTLEYLVEEIVDTDEGSFKTYEYKPVPMFHDYEI